jgi:tetratricopeptide (TPR) repeat protein
MAPICPKCGKEMVRVGNFWICGNHPEPVSVPIESVSTPSAHPFSNLCAVLPTPIAFVLYEYFREVNPFIALWRMVDAVEIITRLFTIIVLSDIIRQKKEFSKPLKNALANRLKRPTLGDWKSLLKTALDNLPKEGNQILCFVSELPSFVHDKWLPELGSNKDKPEKKLIALRNLIAHAGRLPIEKAQELLDAHRQRFESLVKELSFLANYDLIACTKEGQIVWLKGLPDASGSLPNYDRPLSFVPEHERVYLIHEGEGLDLFPLHAFTDILQWREERYEFEGLGEVAPQIYFRLSDQGYLECIPFSNKAVFSHLGKDAYKRFCDIFRLQEWLEQQRRRKEAQEIQKLWDELARELTEVFVGRDKHIRQVKDAIKGKRKGILWNSGKPGVGKSALMAKLMRDYIDKTQHYIVIPYFFQIGKAGCSTMDFLATALKRLQVELNRTIEPEPRLPERQKQLMEALEEAVSKTGKKVLFLVDGLDEIYRLEREFLNVLFMTMAVEDCIVWVCAGRSEGDLEQALKSQGAVWVFPDGLPGLDEQAIRAMLVEHLGRLKYALFERDEGEHNRFVEAVTRKSEGLPLYVRMVIEDLKAGRLTVWDEEKLPEGLVDYYERLLERLRVSDVGTVLTPLFCLLSWAKEPITEGMIKFLLQTHHLASTQRWDELFRRALEHGHLMLQRRPTSDGEAGWTIYHDSFRQHLLESGTVSASREWAQERWLKVCKDWKVLASQELSLYRYVLRHYDEHLYDKWRMSNEQMTYDALCQLAFDFEFAQAQIQHLPNEPNLPLKTVQLALDVAIKLEDAPMMARLLMEHAKRAQSEEETPLEAWRRGYRERALRMLTEIVFERDHKLGTLWGLLLAWVAESEGEREWAKRFLDEVLKRFDGIRRREVEAELTDWEDWQKQIMVSLLCKLGQVEGSKKVAFLILQDDRSRGDLATGWALEGLFNHALKLAEEIKSKQLKAGVISVIAGEIAKIGKGEWAEEVFRQALKITEEIEWEQKRAEVLQEIAREMVKVRMEMQAKEVFQQALKVAEGIKGTWERAEVLGKIAEEIAKAGMKEQAKEVFEQALKVMEKIEDEEKRVKVLKRIAKGMTKAGMFEQALKMTGEIKKACERSETLKEIVDEMAEAGMFEQALKVAEEIEGEEKRARALGAIAKGMAKAGMKKRAREIFHHALQVTKGIKLIRLQALSLWEIARMMATAGMTEWAEEVFEQALQIVKGIENEFARARDLTRITWAMADSKIEKGTLWQQALQIAEGLSELERAEELQVIAEGMAKAGVQDETLWQQALQIAEGIEDIREGTVITEVLRAKAAIIEAMAKVGFFEQALKVTEKIKEIGLRKSALQVITSAMSEAGFFEQALRVAEKIEEAGSWSWALWGIAVAMAQMSLFDQALKVIEEIEIARLRASALNTIAKAIAKVGKFDKALQVAGKIERSNEQMEALIAIVKGMVKAEMFDQALEMVERIKIEGELWRARALVAIAEEIVRVGMEERRKEIFYQALQVAEGIKEAEYRAEVLGEIAEGMAKTGMAIEQVKEVFEKALKVVEEIKNAKYQVKMLSVIAERMTKAGIKEHAEGVLERALKTIERIGPADEAWLKWVYQEISEDELIRDWAYDRAEALGTIAGGMARAGMEELAKEVFKQALQMARRSRWEGEWAWALEKITKEMADAKVQERALWQQALEVSEGIKETWWRAEALKAIAEAMVKVEEVEEAVSIIEQATGMRAKILPSILQALAGRARKGDEKSKGGFLRLLPLCSWSLELAYKACGLLAWLYPEKVLKISEEIIGGNLAG